jgi:hypothetical protein
MDSVHLAHLIIVRVQVIHQVFPLISHQVEREEKREIINSNFKKINRLDLDHMKNMSSYGGAPHIWYSPILP